MPTLYRLAATFNLSHIAQRLRTTFDPDVWRIHQITVDMRRGGFAALDIEQHLRVPCALGGFAEGVESDDDDMDMRLVRRFGIPDESLPGKINVQTETLLQRFPDRGDLLALCNRISRDERSPRGSALHQFGGLPVPAGGIVDLAGGLERSPLLVRKKRKHFRLLLRILIRIPHERRIADDVVEMPAFRERGLPVRAEGVILADMRIAFERQELERLVKDLLDRKSTV